MHQSQGPHLTERCIQYALHNHPDHLFLLMAPQCVMFLFRFKRGSVPPDSRLLASRIQSSSTCSQRHSPDRCAFRYELVFLRKLTDADVVGTGWHGPPSFWLG